MAARTVIVPFQAFRHVVGDSDVMARRIGGTSEDINDSLVDPVHDGWHRTDRTGHGNKAIRRMGD